jgi:hypothetical protein
MLSKVAGLLGGLANGEHTERRAADPVILSRSEESPLRFPKRYARDTGRRSFTAVQDDNGSG